jgi:hypothetical protein
MEMPDIIKNVLPRAKDTVTNAIDRGVGFIGVSLTDTKDQSQLKSLNDLQIVDPTIAECRRAMVIDPTVSSSVLSTVMFANGNYKIVGDKGHDPEALDYIEKKMKEWNIRSVSNNMSIKALVDGRSFIRKAIVGPEITRMDFLTYDEKAYNFIAVTDQKTGELLGYKQKGMVYDIPSNWKAASFDEVADPSGEEEEFNFEPWEVVSPKLFADNTSLVMKALDDVYCLKLIKNSGPKIIKRAFQSVGVEVGTEANPYMPFEKSDNPQVKQAKVDRGLEKIADDFSKKETKDTIVHTYGSKPYMIGSGRTIDVTPFTNFYKQEIREALLTPDSRFSSATGGRFTAAVQSGNMGSKAVVKYVQDHNQWYIDNFMIDHQLSMANYEDSISLIHIQYEEIEPEDDKTLAEIGKIMEDIYPSMSEDNTLMRMQAFYPKYFKLYQDSITLAAGGDNDRTIGDSTITNAVEPFGIVDNSNAGQIVDLWTKTLVKEGVIKASV